MARTVNFGGLPKEYSNLQGARAVIVPVPYDETSTWGKGSDRGPAALLDASANMELYDIETDSEIYKIGIFTERAVAEKSSPEKMVNAVAKKVGSHIKNKKFTIVIGGEHSVSIGAIKAHFENFKDISVLQLDAHTDLREEYHGSKNNHACVMTRARELCPIVQVGIRSTPGAAEEVLDKSRIFFAQDIYNNKTWINKVISKLTKKVYVTIDLDVFDSSLMPSTGTPEPGGLFWYEVIDLLRAVFNKKDVVGFDVVELCPNKINKGPNFLAAKLIYKLLSYKFSGKK